MELGSKGDLRFEKRYDMDIEQKTKFFGPCEAY